MSRCINRSVMSLARTQSGYRLLNVTLSPYCKYFDCLWSLRILCIHWLLNLFIIIMFSLFCASGISKSVSSNACSLALRKLCEDAPSFIHEPQNLEILFWIGEVCFVFYFVKFIPPDILNDTGHNSTCGGKTASGHYIKKNIFSHRSRKPSTYTATL